MNKEKTTSNDSNSYSIKCGICKEKYPKNKLTYNYTAGKKICLYCYKNQFPKKNHPPQPAYLKSYNER